MSNQYAPEQLTPEIVKQLAEAAYKRVNSDLGVFLPKKKKTNKVLESQRSSPTNKLAEPKSWDAVDDYVVRKFAFGRR